jgi:cell division protein FtsW (lipid II flippase)
VWVVFALWRYGPTWKGLGLALFVAFGIVGLTAVFVAYFPATVERLGFKRFGTWLRTWWDEDAK